MSQTWDEFLAEKLAEFEEWADRVKPEELKFSEPNPEVIKLLDDPEVDRLIEEAGQTALQKRCEPA